MAKVADEERWNGFGEGVLSNNSMNQNSQFGMIHNFIL